MDPSILKRRRGDFIGWVRVQSTCGWESYHLKNIGRGEDGGWKRVPVFGSHRVKQFGENVVFFLLERQKCV